MSNNYTRIKGRLWFFNDADPDALAELRQLLYSIPLAEKIQIWRVPKSLVGDPWADRLGVITGCPELDHRFGPGAFCPRCGRKKDACVGGFDLQKED